MARTHRRVGAIVLGRRAAALTRWILGPGGSHHPGVEVGVLWVMLLVSGCRDGGAARESASPEPTVDTGTAPTTVAPTTSPSAPTGDTGPPLPDSWRCVDILDQHGEPGSDGQADFSPDVPLQVRPGLGSPWDGCAYGREPDEIPLRYACAGGWWLETCAMARNVPAAVFFSARVRLVEPSGALASGLEGGLLGVALPQYDADRCEGAGFSRHSVFDRFDHWPDAEEMCAWSGEQAVLELEVSEAWGERSGVARILGPIALYDCGGLPFDCSRYRD